MNDEDVNVDLIRSIPPLAIEDNVDLIKFVSLPILIKSDIIPLILFDIEGSIKPVT